MKRLLFIILLISFHANAGKEEAIAYVKSGQYQKAIKEFESLAAEGDTKAMVTLGIFYYNGDAGTVDYDKAYRWWFQAYQAGNADALANIGVQYRDGNGVDENLEIAYDIFVIIHMRGLGNDDTQIRSGGNLQKAISRLNEDRVKNALCYSEEYVVRYINAKGNNVAATKPSEVKIKDKDWWLEGELPDYQCRS